MTPPARVVLFSETNSKFGAPILADLLAHPEVEVVAVVTRAPGVLCGYYLAEPDPVDLARMATRAGVPALQPVDVNDAGTVEALARLAPDYLLIANFQRILRKPVLDVATRAVVNFHPSPLPRYAGLAPFFWMAMNGERDAGVSALITTPGIDDGPILAQRPVRLEGNEPAGRIRDRLFAESRELLHEVIPRLARGDLAATPQDLEHRTYFSGPRPEDTVIDWTWPSERVLRVVRACDPQPGALVAADGSGVRIHAAQAVDTGVAPGDLPAPGTARSDPVYGLTVACADGWIQVNRLSWDPEERSDFHPDDDFVAELTQLVRARTV